MINQQFSLQERLKKLTLSWSDRILVILMMNLLVVSLISRFIGLDTFPSGLYVDESSIGYNAWSISQTGKDEHGISWPIYFQAFGEWKNPLYIYSQSALLSIAPVTIASLRLGSAIWGMGAIIALGVLAWQMSQSRKVVVSAMLMLASNPWHWLQSRVVFEVISLPTILLIAVIFLYLFDLKKQTKYFYYFIASCGILFYSYTAARFLAPAFVLVGCIVWRRELKIQLIGGLSLFGITLLPAFWWEQQYPGSLTYALIRVSGGVGIEQPQVLLESILRNYLIHWSPHFLFGGGDGFLRHMFTNHAGLLWSSIPVLFIGLLWAIKTSKQMLFPRFILVCLLLAPVPSAVTVQAPHGLRSFALLPLLMVVGIWGWLFLFKLKRKRNLLLASLIFSIAIEMVTLQRYVSNVYRPAAAVWFDQGYVEQFEAALAVKGPYYLPRQFHPGLSVTWLFLKQHPPGERLTNKGLSDTYFIQKIEESMPVGTYILDSKMCSQAKEDKKIEMVFQNYQGCVFKKHL